MFRLVLASCVPSAKSANVQVIAVGAEVWKLTADDSYTGSTSMDFVLYVKQTAIDESLLVSDICPEEVLYSNRSDFSLKLTNARGFPNIENNAALGAECPKGAQLPEPIKDFWCRTISATLSYKINTKAFPFDFQDFRIDLQDDGSPTKRRFCYLDWVSTEPMFDKNLWSTWPEFDVEQSSQCYPPCRSDLQRRSKFSFIWRTKRSWRKVIPRFCMVPLGVVILCVAILSVRGAKERLTASVGLIWTINTFYSGTLQGLSLRSKKIGIFESFVWWNYLVILIICVDSCYSIWKDRERTAAAAAAAAAADDTEAAHAEAIADAAIAAADKFRDKLDWEIRCLILIFTVVQAIAVALVANNILSDFFRKSLLWLQLFFLVSVGLSWMLLQCGLAAVVEYLGKKWQKLVHHLEISTMPCLTAIGTRLRSAWRSMRWQGRQAPDVQDVQQELREQMRPADAD